MDLIGLINEFVKCLLIKKMIFEIIIFIEIVNVIILIIFLFIFVKIVVYFKILIVCFWCISGFSIFSCFLLFFVVIWLYILFFNNDCGIFILFFIFLLFEDCIIELWWLINCNFVFFNWKLLIMLLLYFCNWIKYSELYFEKKCVFVFVWDFIYCIILL